MKEPAKFKVHQLLWLLVLICFLFGAIGIITVSILHSDVSQLPFSYGIGIDAGSSRTDFYVYQWATGKENGTGIAEQIYRCPSDAKLPALASFASAPNEIGAGVFKSCMEKILKVIPSTDYSSTPAFFGATAGMRLLSLVNDEAADAIMASVRSVMASYPFQFLKPQQQARIIDGSEEGVFGWATSNYLSGSFGVQPQQPKSSRKSTVGALDMGGASTQVTFDPYALQMGQGSEFLRLYGYGYNIYTHSYLCYGMDEANRKYKAILVQMYNFSEVIEDPCAPAGNETKVAFSTVFQEPCTSSATLPQFAKNMVNGTFVFKGGSNSELCHNLTRLIFNSSVPCPQEPCTFDGVYQPPLNGNFYAFSGFYFVVSDIGIDPKSSFTLNAYRQAMDSFCNKTWNEASKLPKPGSILVVLCFQSHHVYHLLVDFYGFNDTNWNSIRFVYKINNSEFGWVLGMMLNATNAIPSHDYDSRVSEDVFIGLIITFALLVFASLLVALCALSASKTNKDRRGPSNSPTDTSIGL